MNLKIGTGLQIDETLSSTSSDFPFVAYDTSNNRLYYKSYSLPISTNSTLGGVIVGDNLSIDSNGVLSADAQSVTLVSDILNYSSSTFKPYTTVATDGTLSFRSVGPNVTSSSLSYLYLNGMLQLGSLYNSNTNVGLVARTNTSNTIVTQNNGASALVSSIYANSNSVTGWYLNNLSTGSSSRGVDINTVSGIGAIITSVFSSNSSTPTALIRRSTNAGITASGAVLELRDYKTSGTGAMIIGKIGTTSSPSLKFYVHPDAPTGTVNYILDTDSQRTSSTDQILSVRNNGTYVFKVLADGSSYTSGSITAGTSINAPIAIFSTSVTSPNLIGDLTGNASTASSLYTARTISISGDIVGTATSFNGSANISIPTTISSIPYSKLTGIVYSTSSTDGILSSANWSTFNSKQAGNVNLTSISSLSTTSTGLIKVTNGTYSIDSKSYITGNQTITLSGIITGTGTTAITTSIADAALSIAKTSGLQTALDAKQSLITTGTSLQYYRGDKTWATLNTSIVPESGNLYYTDARSRASVSSTATGLTYTSSTGVLSLTSGYSIPTTSNQTNWTSAYTFSSNYSTNYPDLTAIESLSGTSGFLKKTATDTWSLDTNTYLNTTGGIMSGTLYQVLASSGNFTLGSYSGTAKYSIDTSGNAKFAGTVVAYSSSFSDIRLKKNILKLENCLDKICKLEGVDYELIDNSNKHVGFIAQSVSDIIPNVVENNISLSDGKEYMSIRYYEIIPYLVEAIKELKNIVTNGTTKI